MTLLFLGLIYAFSMFVQPMSTTFGLKASDIGFTFNIMMIMFGLGAILGSQLDKHIGVQKSLIITGLLFFCSFVCTALFGHVSVYVLYVFYGGLGGTATGIGYNCIVATTNVWFPDKVGFSSGVLLLGFGFGSLILGTLAVNLIPVLGLVTVFEGIGVLTCIVVIGLSFVLRKPPADISQILGLTTESHATGEDPADKDHPLKTTLLYVFWIWNTIIIATGLATIGSCASDAQMVGMSLATATLLVGIVSTCNGFARIITGFIYDKTNIKLTMIIHSVITVLACVFIITAFKTSIPALYVIGALCCGFSYGGTPVVASAFARQRFGAKNYPLNLSIVNLDLVLASLLSVAVQLLAGGPDQRVSIFVIMLILVGLAFINVYPFTKIWNRDIKRLNA